MFLYTDTRDTKNKLSGLNVNVLNIVFIFCEIHCNIALVLIFYAAHFVLFTVVMVSDH